MKTYIDLTYDITQDTPMWPGEASPEIREVKTLEKDGYAVQSIGFSNHMGTHLDAPSHFIRGGCTLDQIPLETFIGRAVILDFTGKQEGDVITRRELASHGSRLGPGSRILLKTGWDRKFKKDGFFEGFPCLDLDAARYLVSTRPALLGMDKDMIARKPVKEAATVAVGTPIGKAMPPYAGQNPFGAIRFSSTLVFDAVPGAAVHHCSTIAEASNGDMLCLWYGGSYESAEDQALFLARMTKGGCSWGAVDRLIWNVEYPPGNAVIFRGSGDRLWIIWGRMESTRPLRRGGGWDACRLMVRYSDDNGVTWSDDTEIADSFGWLPRNPSLTLNDGTLALPVSGSCDGKSGSALLVLNTATAAWERLGLISAGSQPTVIQRNDGSLLAYMRNQPRLLQSESSDNGQTWTAPVRSAHKNPGAGAAMLKLRSGRIVLVYNDSETERSPLCVIQSYDDGKTWQDRRILEADDGEYSYPFITQAADDTIHVTYTYRRYSIKHTAFNDAWLTHLERPN